MKQYIVTLWLKGGFGGLEAHQEEKLVTCHELVRDPKHDNVVYADGRRIEFGWSQIEKIHVKGN